MEELNDLLDKLMKMSDVHAEKGGGLCLCLKLASKGKDVLDAEKELRRQRMSGASTSSRSCRPHSYTASARGRRINSSRQTRADFGMSTSRPVGSSGRLRRRWFECREKGANVDPDVVMPICENCFSSDGTVTVLGFDEAFDLASVKDTMQSLANA